ncbi:NYN domain-containing protein [Leptolyngbya sp. PCC 6406]|uniref:NYN domain-containing protein n=1 Tax=Leptolyngbya sp. PCC 6406 TaxID=1173264 RepID=UPI0002ABAC1D|nr:NYN domain-containing protein [Leptolyngbya sp. PCC 6406]
MTQKPNKRFAPVTLVVADCQNVGSLRKYRHSVAKFVQQFGPNTLMQAYHYWRNFSISKQQQLQSLGWLCVDVASCTHNALDDLLMRDCRQLVSYLFPQTVVLIAGDKDFVPLIRELQHQGLRVVVIGRRGQINNRIRALVPHDTYAIEDLSRLSESAA